MTWTPEVIAELRDLHALKCSASEMALAMWDKFHLVVTRSAVIGKLHRLEAGPVGGGRVEANIKRRGRPVKPRQMKPKFEPTPSGDEATDLPPDQSPCAVTLVDAQEHHCRWPLGEPSAMLFCGAPKVGIAYCGRHCSIAYQPATARHHPSNWRAA